MNRKDIIRMAQETGVTAERVRDLVNFAALVASAEREKHKWDIHSCSPTCNRYACVATREAVLAEREACAKVCDDLWEDDGTAYDCAEAIRTLGQA